MSEDSIDISEAISAPVIPEFLKVDISNTYDFENIIADYNDLNDLGKDINKARMALFKITELINKYERWETKAKNIYDKHYRRAYIESSEKTDAMRKVRADLFCEDYEDRYITMKQVKNELVRNASVVRQDLQMLETMGHNLRQQLK